MSDRACKATTKAGKPCKAPPLDGSDFCISHSPKAVQAEKGFGGPENAAKGGAATRVPKLSELIRQRVEAEADSIIDRLFDGLHATRSVVVGNGPTAHVEEVDDRELALKTIKEIADRTEGRPKQATEVTGPGGEKLTLADLFGDAE